MKQIRLQTIFFALLLCVSYVFGQGNQPTTTIEKEAVGQHAGEIQAYKTIQQSQKSVQTTEISQPTQILDNNGTIQLPENVKSNQSKELEQKDQSSHEGKTSSDLWKSIKNFLNEIVFKILILGIFVSVIGGIILIKIKDLCIYLKGVFYFCTKWRNNYFCSDGFAKQIKMENFSKDVSPKEKIKHTYIQLYEGGYQTARTSFFSKNINIKSGIYIIGGKVFSGRQCFLENELVKHNADVFEIEEDMWLIEKLNIKLNKFEKIINKEFTKRLWVLCRKWTLSLGGHSHKTIILLGESLKIDELRNVIKALKAILEKKKGSWSSINHQKLTLILKTDIRYLDEIDLEEIFNNSSIYGEKLEFDCQDPNESLQMFQNKAWNQIKIKQKIEDELKKSQYYQKITLPNGNLSSPLATALYVNTFGQPDAINNLYQIECVKDNEYWKNIFSKWKITCVRHNILLEDFLAFLWLVAILRIDGDTTSASSIFKNISHGNLEDGRWLEWGNLSAVLREIFGNKADDTFNFVGNDENQIDELRWASFLIKIMKRDEDFKDPVILDNVQKQIKENLPYLTLGLGGKNDNTWEEYKEIIARNLLEACIKTHCLERRDEVFKWIVETLNKKENYKGQDCKRLKEIADTLIKMRKNRKRDFEVLSYIEEKWSNWSAFERNEWLSVYLNRESDSEYLKALIDILPILLSFSLNVVSVNRIDNYTVIDSSFSDLLFDFSDKGLLGRVFKMPVTQLSIEEKTWKFIAMKSLEIVLNDSLELRNPQSFIGRIWSGQPYIPVSCEECNTTFGKIFHALKELLDFDISCLEDVDQKQLWKKWQKCIQLLNDHTNNLNSGYKTNIIRYVIAYFICNNIVRYEIHIELLDILKKSNILDQDDYLCLYVKKVIMIKNQFEQIFKSKKLKDKMILIDTNNYNAYECFAFVVLFWFYQKNNLVKIDELNKPYIEMIYKECFKCFIKFNHIKNNTKLRIQHIISLILFSMPNCMMNPNIIPSIYITEIGKGCQEMIYNGLFINISTNVFDCYDIFILYKQLNYTYHIEYQRTIDKNYYFLLNNIYLLFSRVMISSFGRFYNLDFGYMKKIKNIENSSGKSIPMALGELVYQQIAWIFDNYSSYNEEDLKSLRGNLDDLNFFNKSLEAFEAHELQDYNNKIESITFLCLVIASIVKDFFIQDKVKWFEYAKLFAKFLSNISNTKEVSLYQFLVNNSKNCECIQYLNAVLKNIGIIE